MSTENDKIELMKRLLAIQAAEAKSMDDLGNKLFDDVGFLFDEQVARTDVEADQIGEIEPVWRRSLMMMPRAVGRLVYAAKYGTLPLQNRLIEAFVAGLERQKKIKPAQRRILNIHRMVEFSDDGGCSIGLAPREAYRQAKISLAIVAVLFLVTLCLVWTMLSQFLVGIATSYTLGAILGWLWRDSYDRAWGRDNLARRLARQMPFMKLSVALA
jgi:hypothetical protein